MAGTGDGGGGADTFRTVWADTRRGIVGKPCRKRLVNAWWSEIEDLDHVSWDDLEEPGEILDQLCSKVLIAFSCYSLLH